MTRTDLSAPIDGAWLAAFRGLFGVALAVSMQRFIAHGWIDELLVGPRFRFHYWGFGWVEPLSRTGMYAVFWGLCVLALAVAVGFAFRVAAVLFAVGLTYVQLVDVSTYLNHYYLAGLLAWLLAVSPAGDVWSIDAWRRGRAGRAVAFGWLLLFRVQVGLVYVFAGLAKAQSDWLVHAQPLRIWLGASTDLPVLGRLFTVPGVPLAMSWLGFLFDTTIVLWLSWRRTRPLAYAAVVGFHVVTRLLFDIGMFPIIMSLSALVFFDPNWPRRLLRRPQVAVSKTPARPPRVALAGLYCLVQILVPLRSHLYGGNVLWHEQGMRFSWRVMVRAKGGATTFLVRDARDRVFHVGPREYLTAFQDNEMAGQPDLVLQLAQHIGRDFEARGYGAVAVFADTRVSLNGRRGAPMIDPNVDLTRVRDGLARAAWIQPAPLEPPPHTVPVL